MASSLKKSVYRGAQHWVDCIETMDSHGCSLCYEENATMIAEPFGTFRGREAIKEFWDDLMSDGYNDLRFIHQKLTVVGDDEVHCQGIWTMSKAYGAFIKVVWIIQDDGTALISHDHFRILGMITGGSEERAEIEARLRSEQPDQG